MDTRLELRPIQADIGENSNRIRRNGVFCTTTGPPPERRSTISGMMPAIFENTRMRNLSGGSSGSTASGSSSGSSLNLDNQFSDSRILYSDMPPSPLFGSSPTPFTNSTVPQSRCSSSLSNRKFDRSLSDNDNDRLGTSTSSQRSVNSSRYKTELCRPFQESGSCKYGDKCQFAHGMHELRNLSRHPKYKTELCRTFHTSGFCPYGPRCHFIHSDEGKVESSPKVSRQTRSSSYSGSSSSSFTSQSSNSGSSSSSFTSQSSNSGSSSPSLSPSGSSDNDFNVFNYQERNTRVVGSSGVDSHQFNALTVNINNFCNNNDMSLDSQFSALNLNCNSLNDNVFGGHFSCSNDRTEEDDIFSKVTMFNSEEVDNMPKGPVYNMQAVKLDNHPSAYWPSCNDSVWQSLRPEHPDPSPTGSMGSDGSSSDFSSTDSLASGCRETSGYLSPLAHLITGF